LRIRELEPGASDEIELVAQRMRATLVHVLGEERGTALYTLDWLRDRVRFHLDPERSTAKVFLAELRPGEVAGHTIVRREEPSGEPPFGLFSTIYVEPSSRRRGVATALLLQGEAWFREQGLSRAATNTAEHNQPLIAQFQRQGYALVFTANEMVQLSKGLEGPSPETSKAPA
jgi:GNAT superfamily N-acetyltransferase